MQTIKSKWKDFHNLEFYKDIQRVNIMFFLFFKISDSMDVFIPLYIKNNGIPAMVYGGLLSVTTVLRMIVIWLMAKPKIRIKKETTNVLYCD